MVGVGLYVVQYHDQQEILKAMLEMVRVWRIGRVDAFRPKGHGFDSHSSRHVGPLGKSFTQLPVSLRREIPTQYPCFVASASKQ